MYKTNSHDIVDIDKCLIQDPIADPIMKTIKNIIKKYKMKPYNEDTGQGFLKHVLIKTGYATRELMVVLVENEYQVKGIQPVDMFPQTNHIETGTRLTRTDTTLK